MENFLGYSPEFSQPKILTPVELKKIKEMLSSKDKGQKLDAMEEIKTFRNDQEALREIIRADISDCLCDAIDPFDDVILSAVNNCLELMCKHSEFYTHGHSSFAVESIIRSLYFPMKDSCSTANLDQCLSLLPVILEGYKIHGVTHDKKTVENLLLWLPKIQKTVTPTISSIYQIGLILLSLMDLNVSEWSQETNDAVMTSLSSWFYCKKEILYSEYPMKEKLIFLYSTLCHSAVRCLVSTGNSVEEFCIKINEQLKNEIISNICEFLIDSAALYFDNVSLNKTELNLVQLENFYQTILYFYSDNLPYKNRLSHGLSEVEFLQFTTRVISFNEVSDAQKLCRLCILVILHLILSLSEDVFRFPEVWPCERDTFRSEIQRGIVELPLDPCQWLDVLTSPLSSTSCKFALLLYLYFYCMTANSLTLLQVIYPAIVTFIRSSPGIERTSLLVKTTWFIFVMSQLSVAENQSLDNDVEATEDIVSLLEAQEDFRLVYTHHPAVLYWAFSSKVSSMIQIKVVHLWLEHETPDCKEVEELIKKSLDFRYAILDTLQHGADQVRESAFLSMKSILTSSENDELASNIWLMLPQVLVSFTTDHISAESVDYLIELSSLQCPKNIEVTRIIRIAALLPQVLLKSDLTSVPCFTLTLSLLQLSLKMEDDRVAFAFLRSRNFVQKIVDDLNATISDISLYSIRIVTLLWRDFEKGKKLEKWLQSCEKINLRKKTIMQILETNSEAVLSAALDFIQQLLVTNFQSTFFVIENVDLKFVETLFLEIQNVCIKTSAEVADKCWQCLKCFLGVQIRSNEPVQLELCTHPLLYEIISFCLPRLKDSKNMADFLMVWIDACNEKFQNPLYARRIFGLFYAETIDKITRSIYRDFLPERRDILEKILTSGIASELNLPESQSLSRPIQSLDEATLERIESHVDLPLL